MNLDRSLKLTASALAMWGFTSLVTTGQLSLIGVLVVYVAYAIVLFRGDLYQRISSTTWTVANVIVLVGGAAWGHYDLGNALVYGTAYLQIQKLVRYRSPRDHLWLFLLSFFQVVLSAAISVELGFLIMMLGFLGLVVLALALLTLERGRLQVERCTSQAKGVGQPIALPAVPPAHFRAGPAAGIGADFLPRDYMGRMAAVSLVVVFCSVFFFVSIPRLAVRKFFVRLRPFETENIAGFSDQVVLGRINDISTNRAVAMRVWVKPQHGGGGGVPSALRLRGVALDSFDGNKWLLSRLERDQRKPVRPAWSQETSSPLFAGESTRQVRIEVEQDLHQVRWVFGPPFITELDFEYPTDLFFYRGIHSFQIDGLPLNPIRYRATAYLEPSMAIINARVSSLPPADPKKEGTKSKDSRQTWTLSDKDREFYLQLPYVLPERGRMQALANQVTEGARTPLERISRLNRFFHEQFRYSLTPEGTDRAYHLTSFLFTQREGHCETFAAAMAVLCRLVGIPSRVVNGFYTTDFNRYEKFFYVRQNYAHTWVEVWLDGYGWMTVDPTPPAALAADDEFALLGIIRDYWDSWTVRWRHYVVDYSLTDQLRFLVRVRELLARPSLGALPRHPIPLRYALRNWVIQLQSRNQKNGYAFHKVSLAGLVLAWVFYRHHQRRNGHRPGRRQHGTFCPVPFYAELLLALVREGWRRRPDQTPAEFARVVSDVRPDLADFPALTDIYYRVRFWGTALRPDEHVRAQVLLAHLNRPHGEKDER